MNTAKKMFMFRESFANIFTDLLKRFLTLCAAYFNMRRIPKILRINDSLSPNNFKVYMFVIKAPCVCSEVGPTCFYVI